MTTKTAAVFCERWPSMRHQPIGVISEVTARRRDSDGEPYLIVLDDQAQPDALIDVNWSLDHLAVWFLDEKLRRYLKYSFRRVDPKTLFLESIVLWEYPEDAVRDLNTATKITELFYNRDGVVHETIRDKSTGTEEVISRSDVPLDINWEQFPEFGDWTRVASLNRDGT